MTDLKEAFAVIAEHLIRVEQAVEMLDANDKKIGAKLNLLIQGEMIIMSDVTDALDRAEANAAKATDAGKAMSDLLVTISGMIKGIGVGATDPAVVQRINALADGLNTHATSMADASIANTPAAAVAQPATG